ncbi:MAG: hypothetical protein COY69_00180 [Candidatus Magasanikbacteria bacterium CG_4_10_14_0_8_um_filter_32_14]|uniref:Phosphatidic acid phosphatase type 2/haloperoxidase domain-containing protein n=2 Tax=Candidatus Magasanikiibacteriota TaxID=1752731 RepID=A0A2M7RAX4_9BACT|nr:MAG: hypothetical protein AUJ23_02230 [Candidatus Magasanikbacteria bacterium CG1_02_32_51]PIY93721.1 MAG: hypothetical protein COY69_00180 [Candidatus Magasanikbacteria bacterium CG_4_10_14_0_8_um_filter_32_14]
MSLSQKLFFKLNAQLGKRVWFDRLMYLSANLLIYILAFFVVSWGVFVLGEINPDKFEMMIKMLLTTFVFSFTISYGIALLWKHPRPIVEFPKTKMLLYPIEVWKSFPSDHTSMSFLLAGIVVIMGGGLNFSIFVILLATIIAFSRVYVGVHYPRDIVGGFLLALILLFSANWLLTNITQPLYTLLTHLIS